MAAPHGNSFSPGRKPGVPNQTTKQIKEVFARLLEGREEELNNALNLIRDKDPKSYVELILKISTRFVPEVSRTELTGLDGEDFKPFQIILPKNDE